MQLEHFISHAKRMAGVCPSLIADNNISFFRKKIGDLSFSLIAPLRPNQHYC